MLVYRMLLLLVAASAVTVARSNKISDSRSIKWKIFKLIHNKVYKNVLVDIQRNAIWNRNIQFIREHNNMAPSRNLSYRLRMNAFGDMTFREFLRKATGLDTQLAFRATHNGPSPPVVNASTVLPDEMDWHFSGALNPIKNQGLCASSWAFAAVAAIEPALHRVTKKRVVLSEQTLLDCSETFGNQGCDGGFLRGAFDYVVANGIKATSTYPYKAKVGACEANKGVATVNTIKSYANVQRGDEQELKRVVGAVGPVSVGIQVTEAFQFYSSGIFYNPTCGTGEKWLNHAVAAVGYGRLGKNAFWKLRNSWGTSWGERGYFRMARDRNNNCGVATAAVYPVV